MTSESIRARVLAGIDPFPNNYRIHFRSPTCVLPGNNAIVRAIETLQRGLSSIPPQASRSTSEGPRLLPRSGAIVLCVDDPNGDDVAEG